MGKIDRYDPPGLMTDFDEVPGLADQWSEFISKCFDETIEINSQTFANLALTSQYYNGLTTDPGECIAQAIPWNAFPKELVRRYDRERAMQEADSLWPLSRYSAAANGPDAASTFYRPLTEYCEWRVQRDPVTNVIRSVTFTSEPPEYWQALAGDEVTTPSSTYLFRTPNREKLLALYREFVSTEVVLEDLIAQREIVIQAGAYSISAGSYNIFNKWNTTHGIAHLCAPPNSLRAEIQLGGEACIRYQSRQGRPIVAADPLICCANYGGPDRNSDPTIGSTVNALARAGALITLENPVGLYMDHVDTSGWELPGGIAPRDCIRVLRGCATKRMIERLVVEVPAESGFSVSDLSIGGMPVRYGGQIAECITVRLTGVAALSANISNNAAACTARCCIDPANFRTLNRPLTYLHHDGTPNPTPVGSIDAFTSFNVPTTPGLSPPPEPAAPPARHVWHHR